ncbi:unnamed protein product [Pleuronectes platessa]|uniref:Eukaryotic translation initiation factor 3 subunit E N-terminal domain-containing protein n=1 Tax=Pleuronectes platessa TaxID=8262 RepID=A0A9N7YJY0_PLEPL|nr:unnamed protein product [Pleuronectes platessa]
MAEPDLTSRTAHFLDRNLVSPQLELHSVKEIYNEKEFLQGKLDLLSEDKHGGLHHVSLQNLNPVKEIPASLKEKRSSVVAQVKQLQSETEPMVQMSEDPETSRQKQSMSFVKSTWTHSSSSSARNTLSSLWGKLASGILMQNWEAAMEDLTH